LSEIYQQEEISQVLSEIPLSQEAEEEGKVFPRLSEISQGAEAEEEISQGGGEKEEVSQRLLEISQEGEAEE
jgi:hypothetical protein